MMRSRLRPRMRTVWAWLAPIAGASVKVCGPGIVMSAVVGEVGEGFVYGPVGGVREANSVDLAAGSGDRAVPTSAASRSAVRRRPLAAVGGS